MRRVTLWMEVVVLLGRRLARWRLNAAASVTRTAGRTTAFRRQLDAQICEMMLGMARHAIEKRVYHPDRRNVGTITSRFDGLRGR